MRFLRPVSLLIWILCGLDVSTVQAITFKASLLDPFLTYAGSEANDVSGTAIVGSGLFGPDPHALLWQSAPGSAIDLHPAVLADSRAYAVLGSQQVGMGHTFAGKQHALMWNGSAASVVDLHPAGFIESAAGDLSEGRQVGWASFDTRAMIPHAMMWSGTAESVVDMHPAGYRYSVINAIDGHSQVGDGYPASGADRHAMLWHDTAQSAVDLHPTGYLLSSATSIWEDMQVGTGFQSGLGYRALLWKGTAQSVNDLTPVGFNDCLALHNSGSGQVGYGSGSATNGNHHALYWNGTAQSVVDLHHYLAELPFPLVRSYALDVDNNGTIVGYAEDSAFRSYAILWTPVPEPASLALLSFGIVLASMLLRRRSSIHTVILCCSISPCRLSPALQ